MALRLRIKIFVNGVGVLTVGVGPTFYYEIQPSMFSYLMQFYWRLEVRGWVVFLLGQLYFRVSYLS